MQDEQMEQDEKSLSFNNFWGGLLTGTCIAGALTFGVVIPRAQKEAVRDAKNFLLEESFGANFDKNADLKMVTLKKDETSAFRLVPWYKLDRLDQQYGLGDCNCAEKRPTPSQP